MAEILQGRALNHKDVARLVIHIHFANHTNSLDMAESGRLAKGNQFDLYAPELPYLNDEGRDLMLNIAKGDARAYGKIKTYAESQPVTEMGELALYRAFYACRKPLIFADATMQDAKSLDIPSPNVQPNNIYSYESYRDFCKDRIDDEAENCIKRDHIVSSRLPALAIELAGAIPRLKNKPKINTLVTIGSRHTGLYHNLKKEGYNVTRSFSHTPFVYIPFEEAVRNKIFKDEVDTSILNRAVWSQILMHAVMPTMENYDSYDWQFISRVMQVAVDYMDEKTARKLFEMSIDPSYRKRFIREASEILLRAAPSPESLEPYLITQ